MRMRQSRVKTYHLRPRTTTKGAECNTYEVYEDAVSFRGEVWAAGGRVQAELYGERLSYVRNVRIEGRYVITTDRDGIIHYVYPNGLDIVESDGVCIYVPPDQSPDYKVISIRPVCPLKMECMKI